MSGVPILSLTCRPRPMFNYRPIIGLHASESMSWSGRPDRTAQISVSTQGPAGSPIVRASRRISATSNAGFAAAG
ncbi:hypothetical protein GCM10010317_049300 [Streptomyces mirabilis]|nr:hypothetical protein GCM10010317_049300 [Streptomyces mirabilis]